MKKMSKQDVETVIFENAKTGEALEFQHEQHKAEYGAKHFWKADKKFFELLSTFSAAESKVVAYILQKTQPTKNEFIGAYKTIARKLGCDVTTVRNTFKKMMENDMLAKTDDERIWMLNPRLLVKGDIIVKINDQDVGSLAEFRYELYKHEVGEKVKLSFYRDGKVKTTTVTLTKNSNSES